MFALGCIQSLKCNRNTCPTGITTHDPRFQRGLVPEEKWAKVAHYAEGVIHDVETIAHSVGVTEPRQMQRHHVRIVQDSGLSLPLSEIAQTLQSANDNVSGAVVTGNGFRPYSQAKEDVAMTRRWKSDLNWSDVTPRRPG